MNESFHLIKDHKKEIVSALKMLTLLKPNMTVKELIKQIEVL